MLRWLSLIGVMCLGGVVIPSLPAAKPDVERLAKTDWPWWRGPSRDGTATAGQHPPTTWSDSEHVIWKTPVPGKGHGSPTIVGHQIFLQTVERDPVRQSVLCYNRETGEQEWQTVVHTGGEIPKQNEKSTAANSTPACDGERLFVNFLHDGAVYTTALDLTGHQLWQVKISDFVMHQGFSSSPALYDELVIVSSDNKGTGALAALHRDTGKIVWQHSRPAKPNYTSPIILHAAGKDQVFFIGCDLVTSLDPKSGKKLWELPGATTECVTSTVTDGKLIYTSGGYPKNHLAAVAADGSSAEVWESPSRIYVPSMVLKDGYLYAMLDAGVAQCWQASDGKEQWKQRIGGTFSSSLVLVDHQIFATDEAGKTTVFAANPKQFELIAENQLGTEAFATPSICNSRIYHRVAVTENDKRQEYLYCLGQ